MNCVGSIAFAAAVLVAAARDFAQLRGRMVDEQIVSRGVRNREVLRVMCEIPRHLFVPAEMSSIAYADQPVPIGFSATISQPYIVAAMTELLDTGPRHRVLEIGTGSGYQAAVLSRLACRVYTIELVPELAAMARERLRRLGYSNVEVIQGDGYKGWKERAPFDRIILTAAPPSIPQVLLDQLAGNGRLVAPVGSSFDQRITVIDKSGGAIRRRVEMPVTFVPMRHPE